MQYKNMPYYVAPKSTNIELSLNIDPDLLDPEKDYKIGDEPIIKNDPNKPGTYNPVTIKNDVVDEGDSITIINKNNENDTIEATVVSKKSVPQIPVTPKKSPIERKDIPEPNIKNNVDKISNSMVKKNKQAMKKVANDDEDYDPEEDDIDEEKSLKFAKAKEKGASIFKLIRIAKS